MIIFSFQAIGGEVVLKCVAEGSLGPGVHMPTMPAVYVPALAQLEEEGYIFSERVARRTKAAKKK
jgi:DNA-binding PadR family transcriptional regulator